MSRSIHFIFRSIPGSGPHDGRRLPCSGISGTALSISPNSSRGDYNLISNVKYLSLKLSSTYIACNASSIYYRRNSDLSGPNRRKFSRNRNNRHSEERDGYEDLEGSDTFSSRSGPLFPQKFQATATPGHREKEIVELFKKVQTRLRERAALKEKEGKKVENSQGKGKESDTVDSLLKLLRKHSAQQGKKSNISVNSRDFIVDPQEKVGTSTEGESTSISESINLANHEIEESPKQNPSRPKSSFRKKSPVPEIKFQPIYPDGDVDSISCDDMDSGKNQVSLEPEGVGIEEVEYQVSLEPEGVGIEEVESDAESDVDSLFSEGNELDEVSECYENGHRGVVEEFNPVDARDLSMMKLPELRALAKSRGMKGYSKLKKSELVELLSE